jgi:hypothetical protein
MLSPESSIEDGSTDASFFVLELFPFSPNVTLDVPAASSAKQKKHKTFSLHNVNVN